MTSYYEAPWGKKLLPDHSLEKQIQMISQVKERTFTQSQELEVLVCSSEVEHLPSVQEALSAILNMQNVNVRIVQLVLSQNKPNEPNMK